MNKLRLSEALYFDRWVVYIADSAAGSQARRGRLRKPAHQHAIARAQRGTQADFAAGATGGRPRALEAL